MIHDERMILLEEVAQFTNRTGVGKRKLAIASGLSEDAIRRMGRYRNISIRPRTAAQIRLAMREIENSNAYDPPQPRT